MMAETEESAIAMRRLILRDSLTILSLVLMTMVLFAITLFLFRSFTTHRADLAQRWSQRGRTALQAGKPEEAIVALRTALSYAPDTREYELLLADALGAAGHTEESYQYFMGLWETEPGNAPINLQLARLAAKRNDRQAAVNFYRAAVYGTWEGDGVERRAEVRLELARYLIDHNDPAPARIELLIAGGNSPDDYGRDLQIGTLLQQAGDSSDAMTYLQKAVAAQPSDPVALEAAGRLAYRTGDYEGARRMLSKAEAERAAQHLPPQSADDAMRKNNAERILQLTPSADLPDRERINRILAARTIAAKRFEACMARLAPPDQTPLQDLKARWAGADGTANWPVLRRNPGERDAVMRLVYDTEVQTQKACGAATGDDALLLRLATTARRNAPGEAAR